MVQLTTTADDAEHPCDASSAYDNAGVGTWTFDFPTRTLRTSAMARKLLELAPEQRLDYRVFRSLLSPQDVAETVRALFHSIRNKGPLDIYFRIVTKVHGLCWRRLRADVVRDGDGAVSGLSGIVYDVDEERRLQETLRMREEHLRSILATVPDGMIVIDEKGIVQFFSSAAERMFGFGHEEIIGSNINRLMPEPDHARHDSYMERYQTTGEKRIIGIGRIVRGKRKDGSTFPMHLSVGEMKSSGRRYFTGFAHDLTEQQQTQTRLQQLQAELVHISRLSAMGEMASALAHELNQPLAAISNYMKGSQRLLAASSDPNARKIEAALDRAAEQAIRAGQIIRRLRNFVLRRETEKRAESVSKLVEEAGALGLVGAREQGVSLHFRLDPGWDLVHADRVQIQQVLVNLFRNALEAMQNSSRRELTITNTRFDNEMVLISVTDTGHGFAEGVKSGLFQPFFTTKQTGMGVGLSISRTIVEAHRGQMWAESNPSGGAIFKFTLPRGTPPQSDYLREDAPDAA